MNKKKQLATDLEQSLLAEKDKFQKAEEYFTRIPTPTAFTAKESKEERKSVIEAIKVVREGISLLPQEAELINQIKNDVSGRNFFPSKSEIIRAALVAISTYDKAQIKELIQNLTPVKKGRK